MLSAALMLAATVASCSADDNDGAPVNGPGEKVDSARLTIIFYGTVGGHADNQVETAWEIMKPYLHKKDVRVLVCYKYAKPSEDFSGKYAKPGDVVLFELTDTTDLNKIGENYAMALSDLELYDEELLTGIINLAVEQAPARNYSFFLYGHGGGFDKNADYEKDQRKADPSKASNRAVLYDEWVTTSAGNEALTMYEFMRGVSNSKVPHFQSIFFHNCLMGGVETLYEAAFFCDYIVCSSHLLAMNQSPVRQFIKAVSEQPDIEKAYKQMLDGLRPEWDSGYNGDGFNGDLKLVSSKKLIEKVWEPSRRLAERLIQIYPVAQEQLDTAMVHTYQYFNRLTFYDLGDYANKVAEYTQDPELISIAKELNADLDEVILKRTDLHFSPRGDLPKFSLSVVLCNKDAYQAKTAWDYTFREAYEYTNWDIFTAWGEWLNTTKQAPHDQSNEFKGQPVGQCM